MLSKAHTCHKLPALKFQPFMAQVPKPGLALFEYVVVSPNKGYHFGGPDNKDCSILGSILGSPYFGKLPC